MPIFGGTEAEMELDLKANKLIEEIVAVIRSNLDKEKLVEKLDDYHANDIQKMFFRHKVEGEQCSPPMLLNIKIIFLHPHCP